jgi:hypothetical protein
MFKEENIYKKSKNINSKTLVNNDDKKRKSKS